MNNQVVVCIPDAKLRGLISLVLADSAALVKSCPDLEEVLRLLSSRYCHLCVLTQGMGPDMEEVITAVRRTSPDTKILLIANRDEVDAVFPLFAKGLNEVILQPFNPKRVVGCLQALLGKATPKPNESAAGTQSPFVAAELVYRPIHLSSRSAAMRKMIAELWAARADPLGVILRGEAGSEFELAVREYQAMSGDISGYPLMFAPNELEVEMLATQISLDRLNDGLPKTYYFPEVEKIPKPQSKALLELLRRTRKNRENAKPLRMVFSTTVNVAAPDGFDPELIEALQFIMPSVVTVPSLRERREDVELIVRRVLMDLTAIYPGCRARSLHPAAMQWICGRQWPGNYQELVSVLRKVVMDCGHREISAAHFGRLTEESAAAMADPEEAAAGRVLEAVQRAAGY